MASQYDAFLARGCRIVAVDVDSPGQHAAMVDKLDLPFPYLSDPDRSRAIAPFDVVNETDPRNLAKPAMVLIDTDGEERWRFVSRDFADRYPEDEVLAIVDGLGLSPAQPESVPLGPIEPGEKAMPFEGLSFYLRGARFAALAMGLRHKDLGDAIKEDSKAYVASMDRMLEAVKEYKRDRTR